MSVGLHRRYDALSQLLHQYQRVLVAFSGGCDSAFLLAAARRELGKESVLAVTAVSPSLASREEEMAASLASQLDVRHAFLNTAEMQNPSYTANPSNRCFYCKDELFSTLAPIAETEGMRLLDGYNRSDREELRPGVQAAKIWKVAHPLDDSDLDKRAIRRLSRWLRLPTWNKPASPCLSSRIPFGTTVTDDVLRQIERAEDVLHAEGFPVVRVRHYGEEARIEVPVEELPRLLSEPLWTRVVRQVSSSGYRQVVADPRGFLSGRLSQK